MATKMAVYYKIYKNISLTLANSRGSTQNADLTDSLVTDITPVTSW